MAALTVESIIRGYHTYMDVWSPSVGEELSLKIDELNTHDRYAVAVEANDPCRVVGHVPREFSKVVFYFIRNGGRVTGEVRGRRQKSATHMKGLEIPCLYKFYCKTPKIETSLLKNTDSLTFIQLSLFILKAKSIL